MQLLWQHTAWSSALVICVFLPKNIEGSLLVGSIQGSIHVEVVAMVTRPETVISNVTNTFHFEFSVAMGPDGCKQLKKVLPATVEEANQMLKVLEDEGA